MAQTAKAGPNIQRKQIPSTVMSAQQYGILLYASACTPYIYQKTRQAGYCRLKLSSFEACKAGGRERGSSSPQS